MEIPQSGAAEGADGVARCWWCLGNALYERYHDDEWGRPLADDRLLFEKLCLEGFQSGLSWLTILRKRESFRAAFESFDIEAVAGFDARRVDELLLDTGIVRHRGKIESTIGNARRCIELIEEFGSLARYAWSYEPPAESRPSELDRLGVTARTTSDESKAMSKDLKKRGWSFVGPTTVYSFTPSWRRWGSSTITCPRATSGGPSKRRAGLSCGRAARGEERGHDPAGGGGGVDDLISGVRRDPERRRIPHDQRHDERDVRQAQR